MIINPITFGLLLKTRGLTQAALAERARVGAKTIGRIRRGEELRGSNAEKIAKALDVSLETLLAPPSENLAQKAGKSGTLHRLVTDLSGQSLNALTLAAMRYGLPEKTILEVGPYLFTLLAELSLKRRRDRVEAWRQAALEAVEDGPLRPWGTPASLVEQIEELYRAECASIDRRDLAGGFEGEREVHNDFPGPGEPDNAFFAFLADLSAECGYDRPLFPEWDNVSTEKMTPTFCEPLEKQMEAFFDPESAVKEWDEVTDLTDVSLDILHGTVLLRDMPDDLFRSGSGPARREWATAQPNSSFNERKRRIAESPAEFTDEGEDDEQAPA